MKWPPEWRLYQIRNSQVSLPEIREELTSLYEGVLFG
jgi:hypothetical protein